MNIQEIHITKFPAVIFSDSHTNLSNISKLKELYPDSQFICLGDFTFLFAKQGEKFNEYSIQYFIDNKIPVCRGNHEDHIISIETGDSFIKIIGQAAHNDDYGLNNEQIEFLKNLPIGFRLILPDNSSYLLFHHAPKDLWGFYDKCKLSEKEFKNKYPIDNNVRAVIHGHTHLNFIDEYPNIRTKRYSIGQLCDSNHHTGEKSGKNYLLLSEKGLEYKKI